ncbi:MAG: HAD-IIIA family hydrolase [Verrucomicrobia bacterium]|nr:HAD-IIIA family hydrolase [Verrucomicrobiota bacterium]
MKVAVFFERDGVLNQTRVVCGQQVPPMTFDEFHVNGEAAGLLQQLKDAGYVLIATTNQPLVSRGTLPRRELDLMHNRLLRLLPLDDILVCPHEEGDRCPCRKPRTGLLIEAAFKWHLDLEHSFVVSDKWQDAAAAAVAGCTSMLIRSVWNGGCHRDFVVPSLMDAVGKILQLQVPDMALKRCVA